MDKRDVWRSAETFGESVFPELEEEPGEGRGEQPRRHVDSL